MLSLNNRDYNTAEENFREVLELQPKNYEAAIGLGVALRGNKKIDEAEAQYNAAQKLDPSNPWSYFNLGLLYQDYKDGQKPALHKAQDYYRQFLGHANGKTPDSLQARTPRSASRTSTKSTSPSTRPRRCRPRPRRCRRRPKSSRSRWKSR